MAMLRLAVDAFFKAPWPMATELTPIVFENNAESPIAVLLEPVELV